MRGQMILVDDFCFNDPTTFWNYVKKLGRTKKEMIPWEVNIDGEKHTDKETVLQVWKNEYERLYANHGGNYDDNFRERVIEETVIDRNSIDIPEGTEDLNERITYGEVKKIVMDSKTKKAVGFDNISNELLKNETVIKLLQCLFNTCLELMMIPDYWRKAIIHLIPKVTGKVTDPLQY